MFHRYLTWALLLGVGLWVSIDSTDVSARREAIAIASTAWAGSGSLKARMARHGTLRGDAGCELIFGPTDVLLPDEFLIRIEHGQQELEFSGSYAQRRGKFSFLPSDVTLDVGFCQLVGSPDACTVDVPKGKWSAKVESTESGTMLQLKMKNKLFVLAPELAVKGKFNFRCRSLGPVAVPLGGPPLTR